MTAAWIGLAGGVFAAALSAWVAVRQANMAQRLADLERAEKAEEVLKRYREPLAAAAYDLQSRLYNILCMKFFEKFGPSERGDEALTSTLFRLAQYFGWSEILRRDIQFLSFPEDEDTQKVADLQSRIAGAFLTDEDGAGLMVWSDEQRALGELMIVEEYGKVLCMGYARFCKDQDGAFAPWLERLRKELPEASARDRMRELQPLLCELVETLDSRRLRYRDNLNRAVDGVDNPAA